MSDIEWLEWRKGGIGGSDIPVILGLVDWATPGEIWAQKINHPDAAQTVVTERMDWGTALEDIILDKWIEREGIDPAEVERQVRCVNQEHPWQRSTPDAIWQDTVIDTKNVSSYPWETVPDHYRAQVLWQMQTSGKRKGLLVVLHNGCELRDYEVEWDQALVDGIVRRAREFWQHVLEAKHPEGAIEVDDKLLRLAEDYETARATRLRAKAVEDQCKEELTAALNGHSEAHIGGTPLVTWREAVIRKVDTLALLEAHATATGQTVDDVRAQFETPIASRRLNVVTKTLKELTND